jgi:alanyl-tRNA synthetase
VGFERPFFATIVDRVIEMMGAAYPELLKRRQFILETVDTEERQFLRTLSGGLVRLNAVIDQVRGSGERVVAGHDAFTLKDTYGFPLDLTQKIAVEQGLGVDEAGYDQALEQQRERSRRATQFKRGSDAEVWSEIEVAPSTFTGYAGFASQSVVLAMVAAGDSLAEALAGQHVQVALSRTPFYAESGGQVGDAGELIGARGRIQIDDTQRPVPGVVVHYGTVVEGSISIGESVEARVEIERRLNIMRNHTATHLLHRALRDVVGDHAAQAGSLVAPDRLRFDFTHARQVTPEQLHEIERRINEWVRADTPVEWHETSYQEALGAGAMALFGEKYGDRVRMVTVGCVDEGRGMADWQPGAHQGAHADLLQVSFCSRELCGGTHVARTGEIGSFRLLGETSVAAGIRRIEALTGAFADRWADEQAAAVRAVAARLGVPPAQAGERVDALLAELRQAQRELEQLRSQAARGTLEGLLSERRVTSGGLPYLAAQVEASDGARLRDMGDWLRDKVGSGVIVLAAAMGDKAQILTMVTPDLVKQGVHAGNLVKALAPLVGGSGGGRPEMAQAGGREPGKLGEALAQVEQLLEAAR